MKKTEFIECIELLFQSKNRRIESEALMAGWYELLVNRKKYSKEQIEKAVDEMCFNKNDWPTVADIVHQVEYGHRDPAKLKN